VRILTGRYDHGVISSASILRWRLVSVLALCGSLCLSACLSEEGAKVRDGCECVAGAAHCLGFQLIKCDGCKWVGDKTCDVYCDSSGHKSGLCIGDQAYYSEVRPDASAHCACFPDLSIIDLRLDLPLPDLPIADRSDSLVCTLGTFCKMVKPGYACCCHDESNWHPCCPSKCSAVVVRACEKATGKCLDFCSSCLPPGWAPAK